MRWFALGMLFFGCAAPTTEMKPCATGDCAAEAKAAETKQKMNGDPFMQRVSFDFGCPIDALTVTEFSELSRGVTGCGKRATYARRGNIGDDWVIDTPIAATPAK
jgi:hypothetical protein